MINGIKDIQIVDDTATLNDLKEGDRCILRVYEPSLIAYVGNKVKDDVLVICTEDICRQQCYTEAINCGDVEPPF